MAERVHRGTYAYRTDIGKVRKHNDDRASITINENGDVLLLVCDGMGGAKRGELAATIAIDTISESFRTARLRNSVVSLKRWILKAARTANHKIYLKSDKEPDCHGMGTTLCLALIAGNHLIVGNVGDSRGYSLSGSSIKRLTEDQTLASLMVRSGQITSEEAEISPDRHVLHNALGTFPSLSIDLTVYPYQGENILLCTDGLYNQLTEEEMARLCRTDERSDQKVLSLILAANGHGGTDNIGVAYWECIDHD